MSCGLPQLDEAQICAGNKHKADEVTTIQHLVFH